MESPVFGKTWVPTAIFLSWREKLSLSAFSVKIVRTHLYLDVHLCVVFG